MAADPVGKSPENKWLTNLLLESEIIPCFNSSSIVFKYIQNEIEERGTEEKR